MNTRRSIFTLLRDLPDPAADDALLAALTEADMATAQAVTETLLLRGKRRGLYGLVARLHLLDESLITLMLTETDRLFGILREASSSRNEQVRFNVLELIRRGRLYRASYLLDSMFHDRAPAVREMAGETLYSLADEWLRTGLSQVNPSGQSASETVEFQARMADLETHTEDGRQLVGAIESGLMTFDIHRQNCVVESAMWFVDEMGGKFWTILNMPGKRAGQVALRIFSQKPHPRLVPFAILALQYSQFRPSVAQVLGQCTDPELLSEWIRHSWRLRQGKVGRAMTAIKDLACLEQRAADLMAVSSGARRLAGQWLTTSGLPAEVKAAGLKELFLRADADHRRELTWAVTQWQEPQAIALLREIVGGADETCALMARLELARRRPMEYPLAELVPVTPSESDEKEWGRPVTEQVMTFDRYWASFDRLDESERLQLGQDMLTRTPEIQGLLSRQLLSPEKVNRLRALGVVRTLEKVEPFAETVYRLSHDPDAEVRSAAVAALGQLRTPISKRIVQHALYDQDPRVQANAVESVEGQANVGAVRELMPLLASQDNRVRANSVAVLLKLGVREAAETLLGMLGSSDRAQRVSGLWLLEKMGLLILANRINRMAACDEDAEVRDRARSIMERICRQSTQGLETDPAEAELFQLPEADSPVEVG